MAKVVLGGNKGVQISSGRGTQIVSEPRNIGVSPYRMWSASMTANTALSEGDCGVWVLSGSTGTGRITATLPSASLAAGCMYIFRVGSADAHVVSASKEANVSANICFLSGGIQGTPADFRRDGSKLTLPNITGSSVILLCDGVNWNIMGGSGSLVLSGSTGV
jgi:hypothetical protein